MYKTTKQTLMCDLTDKERREYGIQLATTLGDMEDVEAEKKRHMDHYKDRLGGMQATADTLGRKVRDGKEWRDVDCRVLFGAPDKAHKQTIRLDTGEVVKTEMMTEMDLQRTLPLDETEEGKTEDGRQEEDSPVGGWDKELLEDSLVDLLECPPSERAEFLANAFADGTGGAFLDYVLGTVRACAAVKHEAKRAMLDVAPDYPHDWISEEAMKELLKITSQKTDKKQDAALLKAGTTLSRELLCEMDLLLFSKAVNRSPGVPLHVRVKLEGRVGDLLSEDDPAYTGKNLMVQDDTSPEGGSY